MPRQSPTDIVAGNWVGRGFAHDRQRFDSWLRFREGGCVALGFGVKFDSVDHKNLTPNRQDDNTTYAINPAKDFGKQLTVETGYETRDRNSNIPSKGASNDSIYIGGTWKF